MSATSINGYVLEEPFHVTGGGRCEWTFAKKVGETFFLKKFLTPKYPTEGSPGSEATKREKLRQCESFSERHVRLKRAIDSKTGKGGNLVRTIDFFREGTTYFKVTERIEHSEGMKPAAIAALPDDQLIVILRSLTHSLRTLHELGVVHSDLKPDNILIRCTDAKIYVAKLIDFDDSYFEGSPPPPEDAVGDQVYFSPELAAYIAASEADESTIAALRPGMTSKSDIFSLGLIFHRYVAGEAITLSGGDRYPFQSIASGRPLDLGKRRMNEQVAGCLRRMLDRDPAARPNVGMVFEWLRDGGPLCLGLRGSHTGSGAATASAGPKPSLVIGKGLRPATAVAAMAPSDPAPPLTVAPTAPPPTPDEKPRLKIGRGLKRTEPG